jgi:hypothetical protein
MVQKIIAGAVAFREHKGATEWFVIKSNDKETWELPKSDVKSGESSVSAILRYMKDSLGMKATVLEEAGRATATANHGGSSIEQRLVFYIIRQGGKASAEELATVPRSTVRVNGQWVAYPAVKKKLNLIREQKMVVQANDYLKECKKEKTKKKKVKVH